MANELVVTLDSQQWYVRLIEDCKNIITEAVFTSRWALVEGYHQLGERIVTDSEYKKWEQSKAGRVLSDLSKAIGIGERNLYRAIQFYEKYPSLDTVPEGKNISWNKIITKYLPGGIRDESSQHVSIEIGEVEEVGAKLVTGFLLGRINIETIESILKLCSDVRGDCDSCPDMLVCRQSFDKIIDAEPSQYLIDIKYGYVEVGECQ